jgi:hypothetical protein
MGFKVYGEVRKGFIALATLFKAVLKGARLWSFHLCLPVLERDESYQDVK